MIGVGNPLTCRIVRISRAPLGRTVALMISQFFKVQVRPGQADNYLGLAARLKPGDDGQLSVH